MQKRKKMPCQPRQNTHRGPRRKPRRAIPIHHADILHLEPSPRLVRRLNHPGREVEVRHEGFVVVEIERVPALHVDRQPARLDEDGPHPVLLAAQEYLGAAQVLVDVRGRGAQDWAEPPGHVAAQVVVDGGRGEEDDLWYSCRFMIIIIRLLLLRHPQLYVRTCFELPDGRNDAPRHVEADVAAGDVVVCGDDVEDGAGAADAGGQEVDVVNATFVDADSLLVVGVVQLRDLLEQFLLVAAVSVDFGILGS